MTPTDKAAIEGLIQKWRSKFVTYNAAGIPVNPSLDREHCAAELEQALQRLLAGETREVDKPAGVPVSELENMLRTWGNTEHYNMLIDLLDALRVLIAKYKDPHHG